MTRSPTRTKARGITLDRTPDPGPAQDPSRQNAEARLLMAFAPLHKRAFGTAVAVASALLLGTLTFAALILPSASAFPLYLLGQFLPGYTVSWAGLFIGMAWAAFVGFVAGWFVAFCRNLAVAVSIFTMRTRAELTQTRDFLDHI
jgi:hypothetical protein